MGFDKILRNTFQTNDPATWRWHTDNQNLMQVIFQLFSAYFSDDCTDELTEDPIFTSILDKPFLASQPTLSRFHNRMDGDTLEQFDEDKINYEMEALFMSQSKTSTQQVTLEILDPRGELANPKRQGLFAPRLTDLNGKKIAMLRYGPDGIAFFNQIEVMLKEKYPAVEFVYPESMQIPKSPDISAKIAAMCDAWLDGVKSSTTGGRYDASTRMERQGRPGVAVCTDVLKTLKKLQSDFNGMPTCRLVTVPTTDYMTAKMDPDLMKAVATAAFDDIHKALTTPLTKEEQEVGDFTYDYSPKRFTGADYTEAIEKFQKYCDENSMSDGLPVIPPTKEAVDWMLTGTSYPPDKLIGLMDPKRGMATVEKIAINAVMAGAKPEYLPVIIAIIEAITAENFNQFHIVNEILPCIFISGPIIEELGINNKAGYLAPGHRINSTIGRSLLMCMINIGWRDMKFYAAPGGTGNPAAYGNYIIPENQEESPWPSYAASCGFGPEDSVITVCETITVVRGPSEVTFAHMETLEHRMKSLCDIFSLDGGANLFSRFGMPRDGNDIRHMIAMHPTLARQLANAGYTRESFIKWLHDSNKVDWDKMSEAEREEFRSKLAQGKIFGTMYACTLEDCKPGLYMEPFSDPKHVAVMVAGSGAGVTMVFQTCFGSTADVEDVEIQRPYMQKVIHGATLTNHGR